MRSRKPDDSILPYSVHDNTPVPPKLEDDVDEHEVFQQVEDGVAFRTVGWFRASVMFLKVMIAVGVLSLPTTMDQLGAVGGALGIVAFGLFNTYCFVIFGDFRKRHRGCHTVADMAGLVGGWISKEITGILFIVAFLLSTSAGIVGLSTGFNALSHHSICTVWWNLIATIIIALVSSMRKLHQIGWVTYVGFVSIYAAVFIIVVGVTQRSRPAAAPQTGEFDLGFQVIAYPTFAVGMVGSSTIFYSSAGISAFLPIMSEMRRPQDYKKALYLCMTIVTTSYLAFTTVIYKWCGKWIANPSLGVRFPKCRRRRSLTDILYTECRTNHQDDCIRSRYPRSDREWMYLLPCMLISICCEMLLTVIHIPGLFKVYLRANSARLETSPKEHSHPLGHLAWISRLCIHLRIHLRRSHPHLQLHPFAHRRGLLRSIGHDPSGMALAP